MHLATLNFQINIIDLKEAIQLAINKHYRAFELGSTENPQPPDFKSGALTTRQCCPLEGVGEAYRNFTVYVFFYPAGYLNYLA